MTSSGAEHLDRPPQGPELEFLEPPVGKAIVDQMVVNLRRMLMKAGYGPP